MAKKIKELSDPITEDDPQGGVFVSLPFEICKDREVLRWLNHWVVDAMADRGYFNCMVEDVEARLRNLSTHIIGTSVTDLVHQAIEATSKPKEPRASKKAKKRKRK